MKIIILHHDVVTSRPDSADVLAVAQSLGAALPGLGHEFLQMSFPQRRFDPQAAAKLMEYEPDVVVNLVEELGEDPRMQAAVPSWLELIGVAYTGCGFAAISATTDKTVTKAVLAAAGIPTAPWQVCDGNGLTIPGPWMLKPAWEDASLGIDDQSVVRDPGRLAQECRSRRERLGGQPLLVETFIDGREMSVCLLEHPDGIVEALPAYEIAFVEWPEEKPKILNYRAKWDPESFDYRHTVRKFELEPGLSGSAQALAQQVWRAFRLQSYARVDFRLDGQGNWFVLEVNANPCLETEAGFMSSCRHRGYRDSEVIEILLQSARMRHKKKQGLFALP